MKRIIAAVALATFTAAAQAEMSTQTGSVIDLRVSSQAAPGGNPTHVQLDGAWDNKPTCATSGFWSIDSDTPGGKAMLDTLLSAMLAGRKVRIWDLGANACGQRSDMAEARQVDMIP